MTTFNDACFVFVNVHTTVSPASMSSVADRVPRFVEESAPAPVHSRSVSAQPATADSVTAWRRAERPLSVNVSCDGNVALPIGVEVEIAGDARAGQVEVEVLRIRSRIGDLHDRQRRALGVRVRADARLAGVDVQRRRARAERSSRSQRRRPCTPRSVSDQPATADSVTECAPS